MQAKKSNDDHFCRPQHIENDTGCLLRVKRMSFSMHDAFIYTPQGKVMYWASLKELVETPFECTVSIYILQRRNNVIYFKFSVIERVFIYRIKTAKAIQIRNPDLLRSNVEYHDLYLS